MKRLLFVLLALAFAAPAMAQVDIAIEHGGNWTIVAHTTTSDENAAGIYYKDQLLASLCSEQGLAADCSKAEYETACAGVDTPACKTFYARTALGSKQWFMDKIIKLNLSSMVASRENDIDTRERDLWMGLTLAEKEAQCLAWGKAADCS